MSAREPLRGKILVLGLGGSGYAAAEYCARHAAAGDPVTVVAVDEADTPALRKTAACLRALGVEVLCGTAETSAADLAVASPGIPPHSELMRSAKEKAPEVVSEIEFAFRRSVSPWVAVTGTNGKTTTTSLVAHLLRDAGIAAEAVGNIGPAAIAAVDDAGPATVLVAEVSSFQLALVSTFRPKVSVLLNVTPDHVNWHGSLEAYAADKARIFENQGPGDTAVVDVDDPGSARYADGLAAQGVAVRRVSVAGLPAGGAGVDGATLVLDTDSGPEPLCGIGDLLVRGSHNVSNALAAAAAVHAMGLTAAQIASGLRTFAPIEHRLEPVAVVDGVEWFNDSKATNPDAVMKAVAAFEGTPLVLLLGGRNKGNDFRPLAEVAASRCRRVVAFGEAADEVAAAFEGLGADVVRVQGLAEAVAAAREAAVDGDAVVLSPACASFDEFTSYEHRGATFKALVAALQGGEAS